MLLNYAPDAVDYCFLVATAALGFYCLLKARHII